MKRLLLILFAVLFFAGTAGAGAFGGGTIGPVPPDNTAYNSTTWDGDLRAATKNAIRDQIEAMLGGSAVFTSLKLDQNVETLAATKTLTTSDLIVQKLDPDGADRDVVLPAEASSTDLLFIIFNMANGSGETLTIKDDSPATLGILEPEMVGIYHCDGTTWTGGKLLPDGDELIVDGVAGTTTISSLIATTADINAGTVDATIGGTTPADGNFLDIQSGENGADGKITIYSEEGGTDQEITFNPHANMTEDTDYVFPADEGTSGEQLTTDGSGALSWGNAATGAGAADVDFGGYYATQLQNIPDLASKGPSYWFGGVNNHITVASDAAITDIFSGGGSVIQYVTLDIDGGVANESRLFGKNVNNITFFLASESSGVWKLRTEKTFSTTPGDWVTTDYVLTEGKPTAVAYVYDDSDVANNPAIFLGGNSVAVEYVTPPVGTATSDVGDLVIFNRAALDIGFPGSISRSLFFNLALTAAEVKALSSGAPVPYKYIGASQTEMMTTAVERDFSGANDWTNSGFAAYSDDAGTLAVTADAVGDKALLTITNLGTDFILGKRYRLTYDYTETVAGFQFQLDGTATQTLGDAVAGTGQTVEFTADEAFTGADELWIVAKTAATAQGAFDNLSIVQIGCVLQLEQTGIGHQQWIDISGNEMHGTNSGVIATNLDSNHKEKFVNITMTGDTSFTLPMGYQLTAMTFVSSGSIGGGIDVGTSDGGGEVVTAMAVGGAGTYIGTIVLATSIGATHTTADDVLYITDADGSGWDARTVAVRAEMRRLGVMN